MSKILHFFYRNKLTILLLTALSIFYIVLYKIYIPRVLAFGCFDDCYNIVAGYFIGKGKVLYSDIPFNHQMLIPYISYLIQAVTQPINIYELILRHRQALFLFSFILNALLIIRFQFAGAAFALFYEISKFYVFGDRFLAEGFIVYPLAYLFGVVIYKLLKKKLYIFDFILAGIFTWFIIFMREPYTFVALFLFIFFIWGNPRSQRNKLALGLFLLLTVISLLSMPIKDYFYNLIVVNAFGVFKSEATASKLLGVGLIKAFLYPVYLFFGGHWNVFRFFQIGLSAVFLVLILLYGRMKKNTLSVIVIVIALGLANFRLIPPGTTYYEAFHLIPWFGMLIFIIFLLLFNLKGNFRIIYLLSAFILIISFANLLVSSGSYLRDKPDPHYDLLTGYGHYMEVGNIIHILAKPEQTLFIDGFNELIHWQADKPTPYKFTWYMSYMHSVPGYANARVEMFKKSPPDFYYGSCPKESLPWRYLPQNKKNDYLQFFSYGKPSCLYVRKSVAASIPIENLKRAKSYEYELKNEKK